MAFRLESKTSVGEELARRVRREIDKALADLRASEHRDEAAFDARKRFKKVRAALRLVRGELGDAVYRRENYAFRDAARPLREVRDTAMLVEALDATLARFADEIEAGAFADVRRALSARRQAVIRRVLDAGGAFADVAGVVAPARAAEEPSVENLHEWRKQAKYLWHQLQLLEPAWISREKDLADRAHELSRLLGEDHDLAVLRDVLTADPGAHGGHRVVKGLLALIERRRASLEEQAFVLGRGLYADAAGRFTERIEGHWKAWNPDAGSLPEAPARTERRPANRESRAPRLKTSVSR